LLREEKIDAPDLIQLDQHVDQRGAGHPGRTRLSPGLPRKDKAQEGHKQAAI
jgi:hypothetical protein